MRALLLRQHGGLENLQIVDDHPKPKAIEGHVVIRVKASSFNYHDVFTVKGMPGIKVPLPVVIGLDMAGDITEIGPGYLPPISKGAASRSGSTKIASRSLMIGAHRLAEDPLRGEPAQLEIVVQVGRPLDQQVVEQRDAHFE